MHAFEVLYREDGILKNRGFGYEDKFLAFLARLSKKKNVQLIATLDATRGIEKRYA